MTDTRPICFQDECSMVAVKNGIVVRYSKDMRQNGDVYECPICKNAIVIGFGDKYHSTDKTDIRRRVC